MSPRRDRAGAALPVAEPTQRQQEVRSIAESHTGTRGPLLPILHEVVETHGYVDEGDIAVIADVLNLSRADVHGVVTFYHDFRRTPPAQRSVGICRGEACQSVGAEDVYAAARAAHDGTTEVSQVFCLGNCALGPSGMVDGRLHGRLTPQSVEAIVRGGQQ